MAEGWIAIKNGELVASASTRAAFLQQLDANQVRDAVYFPISSYAALKRVLPPVMCHKYPTLDCMDPEGCPNVYARCWQYWIWER